ncbi:hypothetical protein [Roseobacter sp. S98]|uniref:hypothetical protein n=1 Tax=Roseobacter algicola (ex Choi et al. 2025) (nom. illeg.) TaxID=3092138 RepID=UPI0035C712BE
MAIEQASHIDESPASHAYFLRRAQLEFVCAQAIAARATQHLAGNTCLKRPERAETLHFVANLRFLRDPFFTSGYCLRGTA